MHRLMPLSLFLVIHITVVSSQNDFRILFYNVENLFDTKDDSLKNDNEFLPEGFMHWTPWKYREKLRNITRVITAAGGMRSPAVVGLCEVENDSVIYDLTRRSPLRAQDYAYIVSSSPDERGIDVALLYQRHQFKLLESTEYEIGVGNRNDKPTRNILHAVGEVISGDTIDLLVCHFPSRSEGQRVSEPARIAAAALLRVKTDSLLSLRGKPHIIIMGDFNDHPDDQSLSRILRAGSIPDNPQHSALYNLFSKTAKEKRKGTYKYQGRWEVLDQFIVNGRLLMKENTVHVKDLQAMIFDAAFLLEEDTRYYGTKPFRTHLGPRYNGGFSDHLPIYMDLIIR